MESTDITVRSLETKHEYKIIICCDSGLYGDTYDCAVFFDAPDEISARELIPGVLHLAKVYHGVNGRLVRLERVTHKVICTFGGGKIV